MESRTKARARTHRGTWLDWWQGTPDVWHDGRCEEPHGRGVPEVDQQQDNLSQLERLDDSVRDGHVDVGHVQTDGRSNGKADAGDALVHLQADVFLEGQAGKQSLKPRLLVDGCRQCVR